MATGKRALVVSVRIDGLTETLAAFRKLPKDASNELRDEAGKIAEDMVGWVQASASKDSAQSALLVPTVKARRDRVPVVEVGGSARVGRNRSPAYAILFGANFGARSFPQFRAWAGKGNDYFIFKNIEGHQSEIESRWLDAADRVIAKWASFDQAGGDDG